MTLTPLDYQRLNFFATPLLPLATSSICPRNRPQASISQPVRAVPIPGHRAYWLNPTLFLHQARDRPAQAIKLDQ